MTRPKTPPDDRLHIHAWETFHNGEPIGSGLCNSQAHPDPHYPSAPEILAGPDPLGRGHYRGHWLFNIPNLNTPPAHIEFTAYARHWWYHDGGNAYLGLVDADGIALPVLPHPVLDWQRESQRAVSLPPEWLPNFTGGIVGISIGAAVPVRDIKTYGRFPAFGPVLSIWR